MAKSLQDLIIADIIPRNLLEFDAIKNASTAINPKLKQTSVDIAVDAILARLDDLPDAVLDLLAWQWHVDYYMRGDMSRETRVALIRNSIAWHRKKGTPWAVKDVVSKAFGKPASVEEWFDYNGEPYHFKVTVKMNTFSSLEAFGVAYQGVMESKNVRSWLDSIKSVTEPDFGDHETDEEGNEIPVTRKYKACAGLIRRRITLKPEVKYESPKIETLLYAAGVVTIHRHTSPSIFRTFGRSYIAAGGRVHRKINMMFQLGGENK